MRRLVRNAKKSSLKRRTTTGLVELTFQPMVKCGGAVGRNRRKLLDVLFQSMLRRKMMKILLMRKKRKSNKANNCVFAVENTGIKLQNVLLILTLGLMLK